MRLIVLQIQKYQLLRSSPTTNHWKLTNHRTTTNHCHITPKRLFHALCAPIFLRMKVGLVFTWKNYTCMILKVTRITGVFIVTKPSTAKEVLQHTLENITPRSLAWFVLRHLQVMQLWGCIWSISTNYPQISTFLIETTNTKFSIWLWVK